MKYVCLLRSIPFPDQRYIGITDDIQKRLCNHNSVWFFPHARFRLWEAAVVICFKDDAKAAAFPDIPASLSIIPFAAER